MPCPAPTSGRREEATSPPPPTPGRSLGGRRPSHPSAWGVGQGDLLPPPAQTPPSQCNSFNHRETQITQLARQTSPHGAARLAATRNNQPAHTGRHGVRTTRGIRLHHTPATGLLRPAAAHRRRSNHLATIYGCADDSRIRHNPNELRSPNRNREWLSDRGTRQDRIPRVDN